MHLWYSSSSCCLGEWARPPFRENSAVCVCDLRYWTTTRNHKWGEEDRLTNKFAFATTNMHRASTWPLSLSFSPSCRSVHPGSPSQNLYVQQCIPCRYLPDFLTDLPTQALSILKIRHSKTQHKVLVEPPAFLSPPFRSQSHRYLTTGSVPGSGLH